MRRASEREAVADDAPNWKPRPGSHRRSSSVAPGSTLLTRWDCNWRGRAPVSGRTARPPKLSQLAHLLGQPSVERDRGRVVLASPSAFDLGPSNLPFFCTLTH